MNATGVSTFSNNVTFSGSKIDVARIDIGSSSQSILPSGTNDVTFQNTFTGGAIKLRAAGDVEIQSYQGSTLLKTNTQAVTQGGLSLYYATGLTTEVERLTTTSTGVSINGAVSIAGSVTATSLHGTLDAGSLTGTVDDARLSTVSSSKLSGALPALDGSALTGVIAAGTGIEIKDDNSIVGSAGTINFGTGLDVSPVSAGVVTVTSSGGSPQSRTVVSASTTSIADDAVGFASVTAFKSYAIMKVGLSTELGLDYIQIAHQEIMMLIEVLGKTQHLEVV